MVAYQIYYEGRARPMNYGTPFDAFRLCCLEIIAAKTRGFILTPLRTIYEVKPKAEPRILFADEYAAAMRHFK